MTFWNNPVVTTSLILLGLLIAAEILRGAVKPLQGIGLPASIIGGTLGLLLGPSALAVLPVDIDVLETGVYHALGIVFIALSLQTPEVGTRGGGAKSFAFGITFMVAMQTVVGLFLVLGLGLVAGAHLHPGFGLMLPLGFEQGPGQALSMGAAWEQSGMADGPQVGLIIAAIGYGWAVIVGVPLVAWGRRRGLVGLRAVEIDPTAAGEVQPAAIPSGGLEILSRQVAAIGAVYIGTYGLCLGLASLLAPVAEDVAHMVWGFHFMIGAVLAMAVRPLLARLPGGSPLDDALLGRIAGVTVDVSTCAALAAVQIGVLAANWVPILLITTVGGVASLVACVWLAGRAFREAPFEHCVLWFGTVTGTLPMGLALLRIIDPDLRSPAPGNIVLGSAGAIVGVAPIVLFIHPIPIAGWGEGYPTAGFLALGISAVYLVVTLLAWWKGGGLRLGLSAEKAWSDGDAR